MPDAQDQTRAPESPEDLSRRELNLLQHYYDPNSPGYHNGTKSAELAGYRGEPGSNQLAVQASRTLRKARELGILPIILAEKGCPLEHVIERLAACLDAKRKLVFMSKGEVVEGPEQENYPVQIQAVKLALRLHRAFDDARRHLTPAAACDDAQQIPAHQEEASPEYQNALAILSASDAVDRESLRDVLQCDAQSAEFKARESQNGTAEQSAPGVECDPSKA